MLAAILYPFLLLRVQEVALTRLGLGPRWVTGLVLGTLVGGLINLPCYGRQREELVPTGPPALLGLSWFRPTVMRRIRTQVVAVNVGGFVIPVFLSLAALVQLLHWGLDPLILIATFLTVVGAAYLSSEVVPGTGVVMGPLLPAFLSAMMASWLSPQMAPLVAYPCGVLGVLVGADLLRLRAMLRSGADFISLGGAGTFDGIVVTGLLASLMS